MFHVCSIGTLNSSMNQPLSHLRMRSFDKCSYITNKPRQPSGGGHDAPQKKGRASGTHLFPTPAVPGRLLAVGGVVVAEPLNRQLNVPVALCTDEREREKPRQHHLRKEITTTHTQKNLAQTSFGLPRGRTDPRLPVGLEQLPRLPRLPVLHTLLFLRCL